jgi:hypothetical protein
LALWNIKLLLVGEKNSEKVFFPVSDIKFILIFLCMYVIQHCFICRPSDSIGSADAGIEPRTAAALALTTRLGLQSKIRSEKIPRNRLRMAFVIPRNKVLFPCDAECLGKVNFAIRNRMKQNGVPRNKEFSLLEMSIICNMYLTSLHDSLVKL